MTRHWPAIALAALIAGGALTLGVAGQPEPARRQHREHRDRGPEQLERRLRHLHEAAEHLDEAGDHDWAREVRRHAEELERELHGRHRGGPPEELARHVHELAEAVEGMRREMEELHERVERLWQMH